MFSPVIFYEADDLDAAYERLTAATDDQLSTKDEYIYVPELSHIAAAYASGEKIRYAKVTSPSLLRKAPYYIRPYLGANNLSFPPPVDWRLENPLPLVKTEGMYASVRSATGNATEYDYVVALIMSDGPIVPYYGPDFPMRFTTTGTPTAAAWTVLTIDLDDSLPAGRYGLVGCDLMSGSGHAFRFVPIGGGWRPGGFSHWRESTCLPQQRHGHMGLWFEFEHNNMPKLEVFQTGADEPGEGVLDLIQLREGPA